MAKFAGLDWLLLLGRAKIGGGLARLGTDKIGGFYWSGVDEIGGFYWSGKDKIGGYYDWLGIINFIEEIISLA